MPKFRVWMEVVETQVWTVDAQDVSEAMDKANRLEDVEDQRTVDVASCVAQRAVED